MTAFFSTLLLNILEVLKGLFTANIKFRMLNTYNSQSFIVEKGGVLIVVSDKETLLKVVRELPHAPIIVPEKTTKTYIPTPGGYTPEKSSDESENVPLPKGGSGASGTPNS